jgi:hypothetical protein
VRHRALRFSLLALIAVWFGVVVPLHPRGAIRLGRACAVESPAKGCCHPGKAPAREHKPKPADPQCAVCHFLATLDVPPAVGMDVPAPTLVAVANVPAPRVAPLIELGGPASDRGPPAA